MNAAFYLTFLRIIMGPVFLLLYLFPHLLGISAKLLPFVLIVLLIICELSDVLDGFWARKHNKVSDLGKILDPMADSMFRLSVFLSFTQGCVQLPLIIVLVFFLRDSLVTTLRMICALQGIALAARFSGKIKAITQAGVAFFILLLMIPYSYGFLEEKMFQQLCVYAASLAATYTAISGAEYIWSDWKFINKALERS